MDLNKSKRGDGLKKYLNERGIRIIKTLEEVAARNTATPAQVAIAWIIQRPSITTPIASASKLGQLDILKSVDLNLSEDDMNDLDTASRVIP